MCRASEIYELVGWLPQEHRGPCLLKAEQLMKLIKAREARGFTWWHTGAPCYAANLKKVESWLFGGFEHYKETAKLMKETGKYLSSRQKTLERVLEGPLRAALESDLSHPKFHPIDPESFPNWQGSFEDYGEVISNVHAHSGWIIKLHWAKGEPSSFRASKISTHAQGWSEVSPVEAVKNAEKQLARFNQEDHDKQHKAYTEKELKGMKQRTLKEIARLRGINPEQVTGKLRQESLIPNYACSKIQKERKKNEEVFGCQPHVGFLSTCPNSSESRSGYATCRRLRSDPRSGNGV